MYDSNKIIPGVIVFILLVSFPVWYNLAGGKATDKPEPIIPKGSNQTECVNTVDYMRTNHMNLLNEWRDEVVRNGKRMFTSYTGREFEMSLSKTCISCHNDREQFCTQCHNYLGVDPYCWDCHVEPPNLEIQ